MRQQSAIVAIIQDSQGRFLMTFNAKWGGYAFPMIAVPEGGDILGSLAIQAVEDDLGCRLPDATPRMFRCSPPRNSLFVHACICCWTSPFRLRAP